MSGVSQTDSAPIGRGVPAKAAAEAIGCDLSRVYKLLRERKLQGYRDGRAVRVYLSSIEAYQRADPLGIGPEAEPIAVRRKAKPVPAAHNSAMERLRRRGLL